MTCRVEKKLEEAAEQAEREMIALPFLQWRCRPSAETVLFWEGPPNLAAAEQLKIELLLSAGA